MIFILSIIYVLRKISHIQPLEAYVISFPSLMQVNLKWNHNEHDILSFLQMLGGTTTDDIWTIYGQLQVLCSLWFFSKLAWISEGERYYLCL